jgi:hypothetical protein
MISRGENFKPFPLNIVGSSIFGRYPKISIEKTYNLFISDNWMVPYSGYQTAIPNIGNSGRAIYTSTKLGRMVGVIDENVYLINIFFDQNNDMTFDSQKIFIGKLQTSTGVVYIAENNKPQILLSDNQSLYLYDPTLSPSFQTVSTPDFIPGYVTFHDTYFIAAAQGTNTWRLSASNDGTTWPATASSVGLLETKPDNVVAVVRVPSGGNLVYVFGQTVIEPWFDNGLQLFPYQRNSGYTIDYGCINPATIAATDEIVVWLAQNEKSGPVIMYTRGGRPEKITTDGIDYLLSQLSHPEDSQGFIYRQDGHLFYHINFYTDNISLFHDFNSERFYNASDENLNYFIASEVAFFNNQYYFVSKNNGNLYAFDTIFTTYDGAEIPRIRTCRNVRLPSQEYFVGNDVGFTIEQGETNYQMQNLGVINYITEDGEYLITEGSEIFFITEDGNFLITEDGQNLISEQSDATDFSFLILEQDNIVATTPRVDLSISIDGGASFSSDFPYILNPIGQRRSRLMWWQLGIANDLVCQFKFWGMGRFVATDGLVNTRQ